MYIQTGLEGKNESSYEPQWIKLGKTVLRVQLVSRKNKEKLGKAHK